MFERLRQNFATTPQLRGLKLFMRGLNRDLRRAGPHDELYEQGIRQRIETCRSYYDEIAYALVGGRATLGEFLRAFVVYHLGGVGGIWVDNMLERRLPRKDLESSRQ